MDFLLAGLEQHGYSILALAVFLETLGFPVPAAIALMIGGGAAAHGSLGAPVALGGALTAMLAGDSLTFLMGRYTGWWMLGVLCRLSLHPESCILRSADAFYKRGRMLLVFAKFVPGINIMAPPMAGSMNMRWRQFFGLDAAGAALYVSAYWSLGFLFSDAIGAITRSMQTFGHLMQWVLIAAVALYFCYFVWAWFKAGALRAIPRVGPAEAARAVSANGAVIYDVRSHGYFDSNATRIRGSVRLDPNALHHETQPRSDLPAGQSVYLYCTCVRESTSARVAKELLHRGVSVSVIQGGLRAWKKAGLPLEPVPREEMAELPVFAARTSSGA